MANTSKAKGPGHASSFAISSGSPPDLDPEWEHRLYLALLMVAPVFFYWVNPNWTFQGLGHYDNWYYAGFFNHDLGYQPDMSNYAGERLSWNIPGHLLTMLFPAPIGGMILNFICHAAGLILVYLIVRRFIDARSGFLTAAMLALNPLYIGANGWNYLNGGSNVYMLISFWALIRSRDAINPRFYWLLAGASWAGLLNGYIAWIIFTPACLLMWLAGANETISHWASKRDWLQLIRPIIFFGLGFVGLTALLAAIHTVLAQNRNHFFFYYNLEAAVSVGTLTSNPWSRGNWTWISEATWIVTPLVAVVTGAGALLLRRKEMGPASKMLIWAYLYSFGIMVVMTVRQSRLLEFDYFATILLPPAYLALGVTAFRIPANSRFPWTLSISLAGAALMGLTLAFPGTYELGLKQGLLVPLLIVAVSSALYMLWSSRAWFAIVAFFALGTAPLVPAYPRAAYAEKFDGMAAYSRVAEAIRMVDARYKADGRNQPAQFWYNDNNYEDPRIREYRSVMCGFMSHKISLKNFPAVDPPEVGHLGSGTLLAIMTPKPLDSEAAPRLLSQQGFNLVPEGASQIKGRDGSFWITFVRLRAN
jgi:Dolichyl-phosphate-mannose-protein mannosyltransferase